MTDEATTAPQTLAAANGASRGIQTFRDLFTKYRDNFAMTMPRHLADQSDRIMQVALAAISRNQRLLACEPISVLRALMISTQLGLDPSGVLGQGWLVPYKNRHTQKYEAQFIIGYRGLRELARRGGDVVNVEARVVYTKDQFTYRLGLDPMLEHIPTMEAATGSVKAAYAVVWLRDARYPLIEIMSHTQIEKRRKASKAANEGPWVDWWDEMARKTVLIQALKYAPLSPDLARAVAASDRMEHEGNGDVSDIFPDLPPPPEGDGAATMTAGTQAEKVTERVRGAVGRIKQAKQAVAADAEAGQAESGDTGAPVTHEPQPASADAAPAKPRPEHVLRSEFNSNMVALGMAGPEVFALVEQITGKPANQSLGPEDYERVIAVTSHMIAGKGLDEAMALVGGKTADA